MKENNVQIEYWQQETMESGSWKRTAPLNRKTAEKVVSHFEQGNIVEIIVGESE